MIKKNMILFHNNYDMNVVVSDELLADAPLGI